mgnify:CR=1 FL=1
MRAWRDFSIPRRIKAIYTMRTGFVKGEIGES